MRVAFERGVHENKFCGEDDGDEPEGENEEGDEAEKEQSGESESFPFRMGRWRTFWLFFHH